MSAAARTVLRELAERGVRVSRLCADSRRVEHGDVFLAYPGAQSDGRNFIGQAIARGAIAVLWERTGFDWDSSWRVANLPVLALRTIVGPIAQEVYGRPSEHLWIVGVTGTNGKTSTSQWIAQALNRLSRRTALVGTLGIGLPGALDPNPNTTPDPIVLAEALARFVREGASAVAMEVSSIGLDQGRVNGIAFDCAVFTNLSRDHLDYHPDLEHYARAKRALFTFESLSNVVLNLDDRVGAQICDALADRAVRRIGFSMRPDFSAPAGLDEFLAARDVRHGASGLAFRVVSVVGEATLDTRLVGRFNVSNLLAVIGALRAAGVSLDDAVAAAARLEAVPGRMERVTRAGAASVIVDYAHTPDALEQVLVAAGELARTSGGRLVAVFGCGGDRDRGKRPLMGAVAARLADRVIVTSDNPRTEEPQAIIRDVLAGVPGEHEAITDRAEAIAHAVRNARAGDIIVVAGKGHEPYQEIQGVRRPFSDVEEARKALAEVSC